MSRVLISFLGTGRVKERGSSSRDYERTKYRLDDTDYECSFVSVALRKHLKIDKLILIGTTHSMWEEVYREYAEKVDDIWSALGEACECNNYESELDIPYKQELEKAMGNGSKVVLVRYGLNAEEIRENSEIILGLESSLTRGDELFVDITHSFRSLPLFVMNLLVYLRDVSSKKIEISGIYYGMLEAYSQLKYAPIVNLSEVLNVSSWISGAYSFMEFGNAYKISSLLDGDSNIKESNKFSKPLKSFSEAKNLNHLAELENQVHKLQVLRNTEELPLIAKMVIDPVVKEFLTTVKIKDGKFKHSDFQYQLAVWHKNNHNYTAAYISLNEAILTRICELYGFDSADYDVRENMKVVFRWARGIPGAAQKLEEIGLLNITQDCFDKSKLKEYAILYGKVAKNRNAIAHSLKDQNGRVTNTVNNMIRDLDGYIQQYIQKLVC